MLFRWRFAQSTPTAAHQPGPAHQPHIADLARRRGAWQFSQPRRALAGLRVRYGLSHGSASQACDVLPTHTARRVNIGRGSPATHTAQCHSRITGTPALGVYWGSSLATLLARAQLTHCGAPRGHPPAVRGLAAPPRCAAWS
jgi:hypothetical protein